MEFKAADEKYLTYGKPFVLRRIVDTMEGDEFAAIHTHGFWNVKSTMQISGYGKLHSTSLMAFHAPVFSNSKSESDGSSGDEKEEKTEEEKVEKCGDKEKLKDSNSPPKTPRILGVTYGGPKAIAAPLVYFEDRVQIYGKLNDIIVVIAL